MNKSIIIANNDLKYLFREKTFFLILSIFIVMTLTSTYIGWSSQHTVQKVYDATAKQMLSEGTIPPPSPFTDIPPLDIVKNMIIYVVMIGSLLAITTGHVIGIRDRKAGVVRILFSKPIKKENFLLGKILAILFMLLMLMVASIIISIFSVSLLSHLTFVLFIKILGFYFLSFAYLSGFALLGLGFALMEKNSAVALLIPLILWIVITFALPELSSALYPTSSLNPVLPQTDVLASPVLAAIHSIFYPFSISEHYKLLASIILGLQQTHNMGAANYSPPTHVVILVIWSIISAVADVYSVLRFDTSQGDLYE